VLKNALHSEVTTRAFGVAPTGHASMGAKVSVGPDWFEIGVTSGSGGVQQGLKRWDHSGNVVVIDFLSTLHAEVNASQGSCSMAFDGWLVGGGVSCSN
jgi:PmbA protein